MLFMNSFETMKIMKQKATKDSDYTVIEFLMNLYNRSRTMEENDMLLLFKEYQEKGTLSLCDYDI